MRSYDVLVIGGGIAGLSAAWHLADRGKRVTLVEREAFLGSHASGNNAAIFRQFEGHDASSSNLAETTARILQAIAPEWIRHTGVVYVANDQSTLLGVATEAATHGTWIDVAKAVPFLGEGEVNAGILIQRDGVLDPHLMTSSLAFELKQRGVVIQTSTQVRSLDMNGNQCTGATLFDGRRIAADATVIAAGAWSSQLGATIQAPLPLTPLRRHLAVLQPPVAIDRDSPVVWRLDDQIYFRPESGGILASPCDETPAVAGDVSTDPEVLVALGQKLRRLAPPLASSGVRRLWACQRTFAPDRRPVVGADARVQGLYWLSGLGGQGMSIGLGAGAVLAAAVCGEARDEIARFSPERLLQQRTV